MVGEKRKVERERNRNDRLVSGRGGNDRSIVQNEKFMSKWVTGQFGVGIVMEYRKARKSNCCPRCHEEVEDPLHVICCPDKRASEEWEKLIENLQEWMRQTETDPDIRYGLSQALWAYRDAEDEQMIVPQGILSNITECFR